MLPAVGQSTLPSKMAGFGTSRWAARRLDYINDATRWKGEMTAPGPIRALPHVASAPLTELNRTFVRQAQIDAVEADSPVPAFNHSLTHR